MIYTLYLTKQAHKDLQRITEIGLKSKVDALLKKVRVDPYCTTPSYEKLVGNLKGAHTQSISASGFGNEGRAPRVYPSYMRTREPDIFEKPEVERRSVYSRRINIKHRLVYVVDDNEKYIKILRLWSHYE
jgi:toxin YoeB